MNPNTTSFVPVGGFAFASGPPPHHHHHQSRPGAVLPVRVPTPTQRPRELAERDRLSRDVEMYTLRFANACSRHVREILPESVKLVENATFVDRSRDNGSVVLDWAACRRVDRAVCDFIISNRDELFRSSQ